MSGLRDHRSAPHARRARTPGAPIVATCSALALVASGCELEEVSVTSVEEVVVAEVYVDLAADGSESGVRAFLHWTVGLDVPPALTLFDAVVTVRRDDGYSVTLFGEDSDICIESSPALDPGACFVDDGSASALRPGDLLEVTVELADGGRLVGAARIPGAFDLVGVGAACRVPPDTVVLLTWSRADRAWAYVNETSLRGLREALEPEGIPVEDDPLYLLGLSVSDTDTTIVFPAEFGVFNRFELDQDLAVRLQRGLPEGTRAEITITATDRNYVNWARGGNFNPSGSVRVPSLSGDGTGVFGATVRRALTIVATGDTTHPFPRCPIG